MKKTVEFTLEVSCNDCVHRSLCSANCGLCEDFAISLDCIKQLNEAVGVGICVENTSEKLTKEKKDIYLDPKSGEELESISLADAMNLMREIFADDKKIVENIDKNCRHAGKSDNPPRLDKDGKMLYVNDNVKPRKPMSFPEAFQVAWKGFDVYRMAWRGDKEQYLRAERKTFKSYVVDREGRKIRELTEEDINANDWVQC